MRKEETEQLDRETKWADHTGKTKLNTVVSGTEKHKSSSGIFISTEQLKILLKQTREWH